MSPVIARRLLTRAHAITYAAIGGGVLLIAGGAVAILTSGTPRVELVAGYAFAVATLVGLLVVLALVASRQTRALRSIASRHPDDVVFLARRQPPAVSDVPTFLKSKGVDAHIGDGWYPGSAGPNGITVWSPTAEPVEVVLIEWAEIGDVLAVRVPTIGGDERWSVTVDVKPYATPLTVDIGYAWGIVTMAMDAGDTVDLVAAVVAQRPA